MKRGFLITFEGTEGSGKSTQARLLFDWLKSMNAPCMFTREPGGTGVGEAIRSILLSPAHHNLTAKAEVFLFLAARAQLVSEVILPALREGTIVIADRFSDSTFAYQVFGRSLPQRPVMLFNRFATSALKPDLTFLVDVPVATGLKRAQVLGSDRFETEAITYHNKVRQGYLLLARRARGRIKLINGDQSIEQVQKEILFKTKEFLLKKGYKI